MHKIILLLALTVFLMPRLRAVSIEQTIPVRIPLNLNLNLPDVPSDTSSDGIGSKKETVTFDVGIGSGAFHHPDDPPNIIYTITDRGINIKCRESNKILGDAVCKKGKIFPLPNFIPTIFKILVGDGKYEILQSIQVKTASGLPTSGIPNPNTEAAFDIDGERLVADPNGLDPEGIVKTKEGRFYVGEEYGSSILVLKKNGVIIERWVPQGVAKTLAGCDYNVIENLPAIIRRRPLNRGIESVALSPDEDSLYFAIQSPLANPDKKAYSRSKNVRIFKVDIASKKVTGEYVYVMDDPTSFLRDNESQKCKQKDVKISEMTAIGEDELIVLERISKTAKFYKVQLMGENILGSKWDNMETVPSLEQSALAGLRKSLILDTDNVKGIPAKIEGLARISAHDWILVNDNDFGIHGQISTLVRVKLP